MFFKKMTQIEVKSIIFMEISCAQSEEYSRTT